MAQEKSIYSVVLIWQALYSEFSTVAEDVVMSDRNKCSLKVVKNGRVLTGTAAILHATSRAGGYDAYMRDFAEKVAFEALNQHIKEQSKPKLRRVK